jgi:hypothetical protein
VVGFFMSHIIGKWSKVTLLIYLITALIDLSAISSCEAFYFEYSNSDSLNSGAYSSSTVRTIDWLAGVTLRKTNGNSNSPLRSRLLRVFKFTGAIAIAFYLAGASLKIIRNDNIPILKNLILLKLRI